MKASASPVTAPRSRPDSAHIAVVQLVKRYWTWGLLWLCGLIFAVCFEGVAPNAQQQHAFEQAISSIESNKLQSLELETAAAREQYEASKGWLFFCGSNCQELRAVYEYKAEELEELQLVTDVHIQDARKAVGIFSSFAVSEAKQMFVQQLFRGRNLAMRTSLAQCLLGLSVGNMSPLGWLSSIFQSIARLTVDLLVGVAFGWMWFVHKLAWFVVSFEADAVESLSFFALAMLASCAVIAAIVVALVVVMMTGIVVAGGVFRLTISVVKLLGYQRQDLVNPQQHLHQD